MRRVLEASDERQPRTILVGSGAGGLVVYLALLWTVAAVPQEGCGLLITLLSFISFIRYPVSLGRKEVSGCQYVRGFPYLLPTERSPACASSMPTWHRARELPG